MPAPRTEEPVELDELAALSTQSVQLGAAARADKPFRIDPAAAGTAALEGFRLGLERAAAEPSLPRLGQRLGWPDNSVDDDRKREEQWRERDDEGRGEISNQLHFAAVPHVAVRPHGRREPQHDQV